MLVKNWIELQLWCKRMRANLKSVCGNPSSNNLSSSWERGYREGAANPIFKVLKRRFGAILFQSKLPVCLIRATWGIHKDLHKTRCVSRPEYADYFL